MSPDERDWTPLIAIVCAVIVFGFVALWWASAVRHG